jgi:hypothetical protein
MAIHDPPGYAAHQLGVRDRIEGRGDTLPITVMFRRK